MASWASGFFQGLSNEVTSQNNADADNQRDMQKNAALEQQRKDDDYRNMVLSTNMQQQKDEALIDYKNAAAKQSAADDAADAATDRANKQKLLVGAVSSLYKSGQNSMQGQVNGAMGQPPQTPAAQGSIQSMPAPQGSSPQAVLGSQTATGSGAPVQGTNPSANTSQAQATGSNTLPNGTADNAPAQYTPTPAAQGSIQSMPQSSTASAPAPMAGNQSPEAANVQNQSTNNSSTNMATNQPIQQMPFTDKLLASNGISLNDDDKQRIATAQSATQALSTQEQNQYAALELDAKDHKGAEDFLKSSPNAQAWNLTHGKLADGTIVAPINDNQFTPDPLNLRNPAVNIRALVSDKTQLDKEQGRRIAELDPSNPKSGTVQLVDKPRTDAMNSINTLNTIEALNNKIVSGTSATDRGTLEKLANTLGVGYDKTTPYNDLMNDVTARASQNILSTTQHLRSTYEFKALQNMVPNNTQSPQGRASVIQWMKAAAARDIESANGYEQYAKVNGTYQGADEVVNKYLASNPVLDPKNINSNDPGTMLNTNALSFENWQRSRTGVAPVADTLQNNMQPTTPSITGQPTQGVLDKATDIFNQIKSGK